MQVPNSEPTIGSRRGRSGGARLGVPVWTLGLSAVFGAIGAVAGNIAGLDNRSAEIYWHAGVVVALASIPLTRIAEWHGRADLRWTAEQALASAIGFVLALALIQRL